jgi:DDE superfamily endonuclease
MLVRVGTRVRVSHNNVQGPVLNAFNKRHSGKRIKFEWGIGGLKMKWPILKSTFTMRRRKFAVIFEACCKITNFIHRQRRRMTMVDSGIANGGAWDLDAEDEA